MDDETHTTAAPSFATIAGVPVVTIPVSYYAELLAASQRRIPEPSRARREPVGPRPSVLDETEPEIAAFLRVRFAEGSTIERSMNAALRAFPSKRRAVSYQRVRSLWHKVRAESTR